MYICVVRALTKRSFFDSEIWKYRPRICLHKVSLCLAFVTVFVFVFDRIGRCANPGLQTSEPVCLGLLHDPGPAITPLPLISSNLTFLNKNFFLENSYKGFLYNVSSILTQVRPLLLSQSSAQSLRYFCSKFQISG